MGVRITTSGAVVLLAPREKALVAGIATPKYLTPLMVKGVTCTMIVPPSMKNEDRPMRRLAPRSDPDLQALIPIAWDTYPSAYG